MWSLSHPRRRGVVEVHRLDFLLSLFVLNYAMTEGLVSLQLFQPWQRLLQHAFDRRRRLLHLVQRTIGTSSALCCLVYPSRCVHMFWIRMYSIQVAWWRSGYSVGLAETPSSFPSTGQPPNCPFLWGNLDPHLTRSSLGPRWVSHRNGVSISSVVFAQYVHVTNQQTQTTLRVTSVASYAGPLRVSLGPGGTPLTHGAPWQKKKSFWGIAGPLRHCGARGSLHPFPPLDGPDLMHCMPNNKNVMF